MLSKEAKREYQRDYMRGRRAANGNFSIVNPIALDFLKLSWKDIPGYPGYQASKCGQIMSLERIIVRDNGRTHRVPARILSQNPDTKGYMQVGVYVNKHRLIRSVHKLVHLAWNGDAPMYMRVDHIDDDKLNNHADNLQLLTNKENIEKERDALYQSGYTQALKDLNDQGKNFHC